MISYILRLSGIGYPYQEDLDLPPLVISTHGMDKRRGDSSDNACIFVC